MGGILYLRQKIPMIPRFKSYPRVGGIISGECDPPAPIGFKSYPRVGGIQYFMMPNNPLIVSSHTPAWGVSSDCLPFTLLLYVSSHTPAWGVSSIAYAVFVRIVFQVIPPRGGYPDKSNSSASGSCFKSYPRVGGICELCPYPTSICVSSHTPAWGVS